MQSSETSLRSPLFLDSLKILADKLDIHCQCQKCHWNRVIDLMDINCQCLEEFKKTIHCPVCSTDKLKLTVVEKK